VPQNPYAQFNFLIEIDDVTQAGFTEVSGLTTDQQVIEYREGIDPPRMRKIPGLTQFSNLVFRTGITTQELLRWRMTTVEGTTVRRNGSIVLQNESQEEVMRWNFFEGWVAKWEGPSLNSTTNEIATQSIEICYEWLERE
jgi:phage tail-like protein